MNNVGKEPSSTSLDEQGGSTTNGSNQARNQNSSTPVQSSKLLSEDVNDWYSPIFSQFTQEERENVDVVWDWYSPQSKPRIRKQKRRETQPSPKLPIKRQPSSNENTIFNKLKEQLETLREQTVEDTETDGNILFSNRKTETSRNNQIDVRDLEDVFNDSMEEELLKCSQEVENNVCLVSNFVSSDHAFDINSGSRNRIVEETSDSSESDLFKGVKNNNYVNYVANHIPNKDNCHYSKKETGNSVATKHCYDNLTSNADDSFDVLLGTMKDEDLEFSQKCTYVSKKVESSGPYEQCKNQVNNVDHKCTLEEIEQKRKEALAKLEVKKKQAVTTCEDGSPIKCSPEEIEQKRQQALARLEAKKKQDVIERNRQEALKRLEMNKRKRAQNSVPRKIHYANS